MKSEDLAARNFEKEFIFSASRSGGPGGQNVNKVNTKIELRFSIGRSLLLSESEKQLLFSRLGNKLTSEGEIIIVSQSERSQIRNRESAVEKFYQLVSKALTVRKKRIRTGPGAKAVAKRLDAKRRRSDIKKLRGRDSNNAE